MQLPPFLLDHWLAAHDFSSPPIRFNLASSTGPSWSVGELLGEQILETVRNVKLSYAPPEGSRELREAIARFYAVDLDWVVTMTGASESLLSLFCLVAEPGASVLLPSPMFPAFASVAGAWGLKVDTYSLDRSQSFVQTAEGVLANVTSATRLVLVNTPHNPSGAVMSEQELDKLAVALDARGIILVVDEVYHPLYFRPSTPSAAKNNRAVVVSDFSKAFSLPGLRIGWIVDRDAARRARLIDIRSYFTISGSPLNEAIAVHALKNLDAILARLNCVAQKNLGLLDQFMREQSDRFAWVSPVGGTVAFPWRRDGKSSRPMCEALAKAGVLFAPGDCFGMPEHFRVGFGAREEGFADALKIVSEVIARENL